MEELLKTIDNIQADIFNLNFNDGLLKIDGLVNLIGDELESLEQNTVLEVTKILGFINQAIADKDFLLLADLLEFELKHFLTVEPSEVSH